MGMVLFTIPLWKKLEMVLAKLSTQSRTSVIDFSEKSPDQQVHKPLIVLLS